MNSLPLNAMTLVLLVWLLLSVIFIGAGCFVLRIFGLRSHSAANYLKTFWIGWAFVIIVLQVWHLFFCVDWKAVILIFTISSIGIIWNRNDLLLFIKEKLSRNLLFCLLLLIPAVMLANRAVLPPLNYDSGLYHLTSVRWDVSYPIIPGLGNLHGRLAFNSSYFLYVALLEIFNNKSHHFANGVLLLSFFAQILLSFFGLLKDRIDTKLYHFYVASFFPVAIAQIFNHNVSSPNPDLPIFILGCLISAQLLLILEKFKYGDNDVDLGLFYLAILAAIGIVIKLSFLMLAISSTILGLGIYYSRFYGQEKINYLQLIGKIIIFTGAALLPWMLRGIILSGYPLYPSTIFSFNVDWRIPYASVVNNANWVYSWARMPRVHWSKVLGNWDWLVPWAASAFRQREIVVPIALAIIGCFLALFSLVVKKQSQKVKSLSWLFILPALLSTIYWFFTAPNLRFAGASFWILGIGIFSFGINGLINIKKIAVLYICFLVMSTSYLNILGKAAFIKTVIGEKNIIKAFGQLHFIRDSIVKAEDSIGFYKTPCQEMRADKTSSGLMLYVPTKGEQCWDAPLPCTPYFHANLRLRKNGNMRYGFTVYPRDEKDPTVGMFK